MVDKLLWQGLDILGDIELAELLFLHNDICFGSLRRLAELVGVGSLEVHASELVPRLHSAVCTARLIHVTSFLFLEFLLSSDLDYGFNQSETLDKKELLKLISYKRHKNSRICPDHSLSIKIIYVDHLPFCFRR